MSEKDIKWWKTRERPIFSAALTAEMDVKADGRAWPEILSGSQTQTERSQRGIIYMHKKSGSTVN